MALDSIPSSRPPAVGARLLQERASPPPAQDAGIADARALQALLHAQAEALDQQHAQNRALAAAIEATIDVVIITDVAGKIIYVNRAFERVTSYTRAEAIGQRPSILKSGRTSLAQYKELWSTVRAGRTWTGRFMNRRNPASIRELLPLVQAGRAEGERCGDGCATGCDARASGAAREDDTRRYYWAEATITPIIGERGVPVGYVAVQRDITDQVAQEKSAAFAREGAEAKLAVARALQRDEALVPRLEAALEAIFSMEQLGVERKAALFVLSDDRLRLDMRAHVGAFSDAFLRDEATVPAGACLCGRAAVSGELLVSDDCFHDDRHERLSPGMTSHGHYVVPCKRDGVIDGVIVLYTDRCPSRDRGRIDALTAIAELFALAIARERASRLLAEARDHADAANRSKSEFLAAMSHEIRTPMNAVLGFTELLLDTGLDPEQRAHVETIHGAGRALLAILNDILDISKVEAGKLLLEKIPFDLRRTAIDVAGLLAPRAEAKGLTLAVEVASSAPARITGDASRVRQVLTNLVGNAVKFTPSGSVRIEIRAADSPDMVRVSVRDTGIGIDPAAIDRLFTPFTQADLSTTRRFGGTGLGLSLSRQLVGLMGGEIGASSELGRGSVFWFTLPIGATIEAAPASIRAHEAPADRGTAAAATCSTTPPRVLIVDDTRVNRLLAQTLMIKLGCAVDTAENGAVAVEMIAAERYDLVLMDAHMPVMDGVTATRAVRAGEAGTGRHVPIVALTASALEEERHNCLGAGMDDFVSKPFRKEDLARALERWVPGR
ncbi:MAG: ATP-binding protein [Byssovorax sp.]